MQDSKLRHRDFKSRNLIIVLQNTLINNSVSLGYKLLIDDDANALAFRFRKQRSQRPHHDDSDALALFARPHHHDADGAIG